MNRKLIDPDKVGTREYREGDLSIVVAAIAWQEKIMYREPPIQPRGMKLDPQQDAKDRLVRRFHAVAYDDLRRKLIDVERFVMDALAGTSCSVTDMDEIGRGFAEIRDIMDPEKNF